MNTEIRSQEGGSESLDARMISEKGKTDADRERYVIAVKAVINQICLIFDRSYLSNDPERDLTANAWVDVLIDVVPIEGLPIALQRAIRDKTDSYAVNAVDLRIAWDREQDELIHQMEAAIRA